jgi:hypothetical protein
MSNEVPLSKPWLERDAKTGDYHVHSRFGATRSFTRPAEAMAALDHETTAYTKESSALWPIFKAGYDAHRVKTVPARTLFERWLARKELVG